MMGRIYYLMGASASGKDSLRKLILEACPSLRTYCMYTTRPAREGETDGQDYHFIDEAFLESERKAGRLIESRTYPSDEGPWTYATIDDGQIDPAAASYLMEGTLDSCRSMRERYGAETIVPLYIEVEDGERLSRALERERRQEEPHYRELCRRFLADTEDFSEEHLAEADIKERYVNADLGVCAALILERIRREDEGVLEG